MEAPPQDRKRKRNKSAPDEEPVMRRKNRGEGTRGMCGCDCGEERDWLDLRPCFRLGEAEGQAEEHDDVFLRCCCTQCGPVDVDSQTRRCTVRLTRVGAHIDRFMRLGRDFDRLGSSEPFFCEDCKEAYHARPRILRVKEAVKRARQERLSKEHELRGSESASASSRNVQSQ